MIRALVSLLLVLPCGGAEIFGGAQVAELYRIRLDRGDLLLETIQQVIRENHIADGAVLTAVGSLGECTFHRIKSTGEKPEDEFLTVKEPLEILNINGVIADGEPHLHLTMSGAQGAFGGHLEKGCRVLYRAEVTIAKFSGTPLARKANREGVPLLQRK
ncbi:MAG TPA: PPC domain-containing DNA-binding protein [Bryobacteraceae bacterium]|nr:PPC domain-containing DNA-binding protein [Bryobacteraceae bacterium]